MWAIKIPRFCGLSEGKTISRVPHKKADTHTVGIKKRLIKHTHIDSYKSTYTVTQDK